MITSKQTNQREVNQSYEEEFVLAQSLDDRESIDPQLLTGGLKAFLSFFKEALGVPDQISSIKLDQYSILPFEIDTLVVY